MDLNQHNNQQRDYYHQQTRKAILPGKSPYILRHLHELIAHGKLMHGEKILEVGSGMGRHAFLLAEQGLDVECLELSPFLIEKLKEYDNGRYNLSTHCGDIHHPPKELDKKFDVVIGFFILHHLLNLDQTFQSIAQVLKPGGRVIFLEPNPYNPLYYLQILFTKNMSWQAERKMLDMRPQVLFKAMQKAGLSNMEIKRFGFFPPFLTNLPGGQKIESYFEKFPLWRKFLPFQLFMGHLDSN